MMAGDTIIILGCIFYARFCILPPILRYRLLDVRVIWTLWAMCRHPTAFFQSRGRGGHIFTGYPFCMVAKMEKQQVWRANCMDAIILGCVLLRISRIFCILNTNTAHLFVSKTNLFIWESFDRYKQCVIRRFFLTLVAEGRVLLTVAKEMHMSEFYEFHFQLESLLLSMRNSTAERHFAIDITKWVQCNNRIYSPISPKQNGPASRTENFWPRHFTKT